MLEEAAYLFSNGRLQDFLATRQQELNAEVAGYDPDVVLSTPVDDLAESLLERFTVELPILHRDGITTLPSQERLVEVAQYSPFPPQRRKIIRRRFAIPFTGHPEVLHRQPNTFGPTPPIGYVDAKTAELQVVLDEPAGPQPDPQQINRSLHEALDNADRFLEWARPDVENYSRYVATIGQRLAVLREKILTDRSIEDAIGYPVRRREDANRYVVPVRRKTIKVTTPPRTAQPFTPEPVLGDNDYEAALNVLTSSRNALERTPSMTATLTEERIRDLLLVNLNAQFEGAAAGEVFNGSGKTDILIREKDRNIFIAECKIWKGPKTISDALDQLLGYLVWRDTKAAMLLFIRSGKPTEIIEKSLATIETHPNYKRTLRRGPDGERSDFVVHATGDQARDIRLAFLPFVPPFE